MTLLALLGRAWPFVSEEARYRYVDRAATLDGSVELCCVARLDRAAMAAFVDRQTLADLSAADYTGSGATLVAEWRHGVAGAPSFLYAPTRLPDLPAAFLETAWSVMAAETIDAVVLGERLPGFERPKQAADVLREPWRSYALFSAASFELDRQGEIRPKKRRWVVKVIGGQRPPAGRKRRWDYLATYNLGYRPDFGVCNAGAVPRRPAPAGRRLLVTVPFFAKGGVEHTLFETLRALPEIEPLFVSLAPHRPELGDRRADFEQIHPRLLPLGDLVHPAAMPDLLDQLIATYQPFALYNANGTTLFYDFAPRLKQRWPELRILDHLYDHQVGYIDRYSPTLLGAVDACIAENARIADTLQRDYGWPADRTPVVWPCGRRDEQVPSADVAAAARRRLRAELGIGNATLVFLVAARLHEQKRPLDLPALALRVRDLPVHFLQVGGGDLEREVDQAVAAARAAGAPITRLPFRDDIPALIAASDVGCLVSAYEGLPIFLLENLQQGHPFLGTDVGALGDVLRETGAGWVVDTPGDLDALERAVRRIHAGTDREAKEAAARAAGPRFGVEACAQRYLAVFEGRP